MNTTATPEAALRRPLMASGVITAASGVAMMLRPKPLLRMAGASAEQPAPFLFGVVGMFMTLSGGLLAQGAAARPADRRALQYSLAQKVGATAAVGLGVKRGRYKRRALLVASFDAASAALIAASLVCRRSQ
ncbi:MAG: hypothetical protein JWL70_2824 [Acidimicrobiia bacterium]|nr:hypothetical protein [Acidimicrobiia bacterium]